MNQELFSYLAASPTPFHAVAHSAKLLEQSGCIRLTEREDWTLEPGKSYYVTRNGSSLIAFRLPGEDFTGFQIAAAHTDSPCLKIREQAESVSAGCVRLSAEPYGGMLRFTWTDRPLSIAGRVLVRTERGAEARLIDFGKPVAVIPNVAIHMNRKANEDMSWNPAVDLLPLYRQEGSAVSLREAVAELAGVKEADLLSWDLMLYNPQSGVEWGDYISAPRLDDLQCAFSALKGFLEAKESSAAAVCCLFDNEEVGSLTKQGASSTFLRDTLLRVNETCGRTPAEFRQAVAQSFLLSCDNAHAVHPNHPEYADKNHPVRMNGGIVLKFNAMQKYTSDAVSAAVVRMLCERVSVPTQIYVNRADMAGGSTLGNLVNAQVSLNAADIGLAQLAMHSSFETAGARDTEYLVRTLREFFGTALDISAPNAFCLR